MVAVLFIRLPGGNRESGAKPERSPPLYSGSNLSNVPLTNVIGTTNISHSTEEGLRLAMTRKPGNLPVNVPVPCERKGMAFCDWPKKTPVWKAGVFFIHLLQSYERGRKEYCL